jgi:hypothetical protein
MTIWIVTTGNSDIQLKDDRNWSSLYDEVRDKLECGDRFASPTQIDPDDKKAGYTVPARVLGLTYGNQPDYYETDLKFPLLDTYRDYFKTNNINPKKIIILLTDQSHIFLEEKIIYEKCPYWQDTCKLQPLFEWYLKKYFDCQLNFESLTPKSGQGIDHWNQTLLLVEETLPKLDSDEPVYVSHQAGTPAISSAIQFVSLGRFKEVKFLVSNQYFDDNYEQVSKSDKIESSHYWRGMQIQKAKQLIKEGLPAAAKEILTGIVDSNTITQLNDIVDLFNIKGSSANGQEFEIKPATERVVTGLDLIEIFFKQENYIQGIAILSACQEIFLKIAIISQSKTIERQLVKLSSLVTWNNKGLFLKSQSDLKKIPYFQKPLNILHSLKFPVPNKGEFDFQFWCTYQKQEDQTFKLNNSRQFKWLCELKPDFKAWAILEWSCQYKREREDDLRNQLLHNLRGVEKDDVRNYLLGHKEDSIKIFLGKSKDEINQVYLAYIEYVKKPFFKSLKFFGLWSNEDIENKLEQKLQEIADSLV